MKNKVFVSLVAVLLFAVGAFAADVTGKWTSEMKGRDGQVMQMTYNFKAEGGKLTGTVASPMGEREISDGKVEGDNISFKMKMEFGGNPVVMVYTGTVSGDEIKFTSKREGGDRPPREFVAKRAK
jgi:uncharacterized protein YndB with AHSA1/START domain